MPHGGDKKDLQMSRRSAKKEEKKKTRDRSDNFQPVIRRVNLVPRSPTVRRKVISVQARVRSGYGIKGDYSWKGVKFLTACHLKFNNNGGNNHSAIRPRAKPKLPLSIRDIYNAARLALLCSYKLHKM